MEVTHRYANANIPVDYWSLDMDHFHGDPNLLAIYKKITQDITASYNDGVKICFAGNHGTGKTMTSCCILKRVVEKGYTSLYVTLTDIVNILVTTSPNRENKLEARQALLGVDFLVIDEFDQRFMGSDNASDLYGRILEPMLRHRVQNKLPLILCTNSPNVTSSFNGSLKTSITSLMHLVKPIIALGPDVRAGGKK